MATFQIHTGDALEVSTRLESQSVQTVVTSPPYFGLRDYGTAKWEGGDGGCDHKQGRNGSGRADGIVDERGQRNRDGVGAMGGNCRRCGALRIDSQLGLEATPEQYVERLVGIFREVRRVMRDDATLWLNIGDSYTGSGKGGNPEDSKWKGFVGNSQREAAATAYAGTDRLYGLPPKNLIGVPWRVAFALQADGWYLRQDIIWAKPNPMPESVEDRCTKAHEYIFLLSKSARYYYDAEAVREPNASPAQLEHNLKYAKQYSVYDERAAFTGQPGNVNNVGIHSRPGREGRNRRSVWTVATQPFPGSHFAVFPPELIEPCILAGSREGDTVFDPFTGSGTTGLVALRYGRNFVGCELNPEYVEMTRNRIRDDAPMFNVETAA